MKKLFLAGAFALLGAVSLNAQQFGLTGGLAVLSGKVTVQGQSETDSQTGGYVGLFGDFPVGTNLKFVPGVNYVFAEDGGAFQIPLIFKYNVAEKFNLQAGPQFMFDTEDVPAEVKDYYNRLNFGLALGAGFDIMPQLFIEARYGIQLNDHFKNLPSGADYSAKVNVLNVGLGYKF